MAYCRYSINFHLLINIQILKLYIFGKIISTDAVLKVKFCLASNFSLKADEFCITTDKRKKTDKYNDLMLVCLI